MGQDGTSITLDRRIEAPKRRDAKFIVEGGMSGEPGVAAEASGVVLAALH